MQIAMNKEALQRAVKLHTGSDITPQAAGKILKQFMNDDHRLSVLKSTMTQKPLLHVVRCKSGLRVVPALFEVTVISMKKA